MPVGGCVSCIFEDTKDAARCLGPFAHLLSGRDRDGQGLLCHQVKLAGKRVFCDTMMERVDRVIINRVYFPRINQFTVVREYCDVDIRLKVREVLVADGERVTGQCAYCRTLCDSVVAIEIHFCVGRLPRTESRDLKIIDARLTQEPIAAQMRS
jgi:hypothetical protein